MVLTPRVGPSGTPPVLPPTPPEATEVARQVARQDAFDAKGPSSSQSSLTRVPSPPQDPELVLLQAKIQENSTQAEGLRELSALAIDGHPLARTLYGKLLFEGSFGLAESMQPDARLETLRALASSGSKDCGYFWALASLDWHVEMPFEERLAAISSGTIEDPNVVRQAATDYKTICTQQAQAVIEQLMTATQTVNEQVDTWLAHMFPPEAV